MLENEELEDYLMGDNAENDGNTGDSSSAEKDLLKELKQISEEIGTQQAGDGMAFEPKPAGITFAL